MERTEWKLNEIYADTAFIDRFLSFLLFRQIIVFLLSQKQYLHGSVNLK